MKDFCKKKIEQIFSTNLVVEIVSVLLDISGIRKLSRYTADDDRIARRTRMSTRQQLWIEIGCR